MTITREQREAIRDGIKALVEPCGGVLNEQVLNDIFTLSEAGDPAAILKLRKIHCALETVVKGTAT